MSWNESVANLSDVLTLRPGFGLLIYTLWKKNEKTLKKNVQETSEESTELWENFSLENLQRMYI